MRVITKPFGMTRFIVAFALLACLAGYVDGANPFDEDEATDTSTTDTTDTGTDSSDTDSSDTDADTETSDTDEETETNPVVPIVSSVNTLPGTENPTSSSAIFRSEARSDSGGSVGNGYARGFVYNSDADTFTVDNIAFDGDSPYTAVFNDDGTTRLGVGPFSVFEAPASATDALTLATVNQLVDYRALYAVGPDGNTSIAIVRTGAYIEYGYGGYLYQRDGDVTLPTSGQGVFTGTDNYGGLRDFDGRGGLEYVKGDMRVEIDFDDFNDGAGVRGNVTNRQVYNIDDITNVQTLAEPDPGNVTQDILDAMGGGATELPILKFKIGPGVMDANGELQGEIFSASSDASTTLESGNYYAILSGDDATTITGIVVVTGSDPRYTGITYRETAGFFAVRQ